MAFIGKQPGKAAITSTDITDGIITADKLASNAVTTAKINADAVTDAKIADDVVGTEHLTAGEVDTTALGADAVTAAKIADNAISEEHLDATVVTGLTALAAEPADTDEFLVSDAGTLKRIDYSYIKGGGITEADQWRLTSNITSFTDPISSNLERVDDASFGYIGSGMSVSSGVWTFASTGIYQVLTTLKGNSSASGDTYRIEIWVSTDGGSNYDQVGGTNLGAASSTAAGFTATTSNFIDVTNTSNVKLKFVAASITSGSIIEGITDYNKTCFTFIRLGDT